MIKKGREDLSDLQYKVCYQKGTEAPFSGALLDNKQTGRYLCLCCNAPLFGSEAKYDSGTGWPSFFAPINEQAVLEKSDKSHGMERIEVVCAHCAAHLGHVFPDGPKPSGLRYCLNSVALSFEHL